MWLLAQKVHNGAFVFILPHTARQTIGRISKKFHTEDFVPNVVDLIVFYSYEFNKTILCSSLEQSSS